MATTSIAFYAFECGLFDFVIRCGRISTRIRDFRSRRLWIIARERVGGWFRWLNGMKRRLVGFPWQYFTHRGDAIPATRYTKVQYPWLKLRQAFELRAMALAPFILITTVSMYRDVKKRGVFFFFKLDRLKYYILLGEEITLTVFLYQFKIVEN